MKQYLWNLIIALDQLGNALLGGDPDETISARLGRSQLRGSRYGHWLAVLLDKIDPGHCRRAALGGDGGKEL